MLHYHADWKNAYCAKQFRYYKTLRWYVLKEFSLTTVADYWYAATDLRFSQRRD